MKKVKVFKIIFIYCVVTALIIFLTGSLTSCYNKSSTVSSASDNLSVISNDSSIETLQNSDTSNTDTSSTDKAAVGKKINFVIVYNFDILGDTSKIDFITIIPNDYEDRQQVSGIDYSISPARIFTDGLNKYAEFLISNPLSDFELKITTHLVIYEYDLERAMILKKDQTPEEDFSKYLVEEKYI